MTPLRPAFTWLQSEPGPRMLVEALKLYGIRETAGPKNTPEIMAWADELGAGVASVYSGDSIPWCGLFMGVVAKRAGKPLPPSPLWALSWSTWGQPAPTPMLGDVLTYRRAGGGHVGLYVGESAQYHFVLGGNQNDGVTIIAKPKVELYAARRFYRMAPPANVRPVVIDANAPLKASEA